MINNNNSFPRSLKEKSFSNHKYFTYFLERGIRSLNNLTANDSHCKLNSSILFNKQTLPVTHESDKSYAVEQFTLVNGDRSFMFKVEFPQNAKIELLISPMEGILKKVISLTFFFFFFIQAQTQNYHIN